MKKRNIILFSLLALLLASCEQEPTVHKPMVLEGHEVVNLGLPSGTLWATCNVGAALPEDIGGYFSWGETEEKDAYYDYDYKFYDWDARFLISKYSTDSIHWTDGWMDNLTILEPADDAATVNWGENYRMPTRKEFQELIDHCAWEWTTSGHRYGYRVTGKDEASIFLPAAGCRSQDLYYDVNLEGEYWSSSLCTYHNIDAYAFVFGSNKQEVTAYGQNRHIGKSVRAVYSPK